MSESASVQVLCLFLVFCRVGSCLMIMPGFSSARLPAQIRLFLALAVSFALSPALIDSLRPLVEGASDAERIALIVTEVLNGAMIGLLGRTFLLALQFAGHVVANAIGMGQALGTAIEDNEPGAAIVSLITLTATTLIFVLNLHAEIARALVDSYSAIPPVDGFAARRALANFTDNLDEAFLLCLRISSPFILYAVIVNFAIGLANKMTPTIPVYFISLPFVLAGGLILFGYAMTDFFVLFMQDFTGWVVNG